VTWMPRRVVTGHDTNGKSVFVSDGAPPVVSTAPDGAGFFEIWSTNGAPAAIPADEPDPAAGPVVVPPPPHGTKIRFNSFPPGTVSSACAPPRRRARPRAGVRAPAPEISP
jgi:hypothetical protein